VICEGDAEDGNEAAEAFESASKRLRLTTSEKDDEIALSLGKLRRSLLGKWGEGHKKDIRI
jgi:hypothetical protein